MKRWEDLKRKVQEKRLTPGGSKVRGNPSTPENREFWARCEKAAEEVATWPAWKRAAANLRDIGITEPEMRALETSESPENDLRSFLGY
jgi:hypothetical protein